MRRGKLHERLLGILLQVIFRLLGSGLRVLGFRVEDSGLGVRIQGSVCSAQGKV